jgi:hypothetical protein
MYCPDFAVGSEANYRVSVITFCGSPGGMVYTSLDYSVSEYYLVYFCHIIGIYEFRFKILEMDSAHK